MQSSLKVTEHLLQRTATDLFLWVESRAERVELIDLKDRKDSE